MEGDPTLINLDLGKKNINSTIGSKGAKMLAEALYVNTTLQCLNLQ
jgi:hypothetical protein